VVIELRNADDENATTNKAFDQLQTYKLQLPTLMTDRFLPWRTTDGKEITRKGKPEFQTIIHGVFEKEGLLRR
jgi:type I restriction enzyme R subunit